jgi:hypothetical protein
MEPIVSMMSVCSTMAREREDHKLPQLILPRVGAAYFNVASGVRGSNQKPNHKILWVDPFRKGHG